MTDPTPEDRLTLDALQSAVADACRSQWTIARLRGPEWLDIATAPTVAIRDALDAAWRMGCMAGIGCEECSCCKQLKPVHEIDGDLEGECMSCREAHGRG